MADNIEPSPKEGNPRSRLLSVKEAAAYLRMSPNWLRASRIPCVRFGRSRRYQQSDLENHIEAHRSLGPSRRHT